MKISATFSPCGRFRHDLVIVWDETLPRLSWVLYNPSVAGRAGTDGAAELDPTARKGVGFSKRLGYGSLVFTNLYDFVSTDPKGLKAAGYPYSDRCDLHILMAAQRGKPVICAWGALARGQKRAADVLAMLRGAGCRPMALGFTDDGLPRHPLMLGYDTQLSDIRW